MDDTIITPTSRPILHSNNHNGGSICNQQNIQLLTHPRIVSATPPRSQHSASYARSRSGISCMDIDRGRDEDTNSPPRYLLVGSGGGDCSIALYDLSYFGSDQYLYQQSSSSKSSLSSQTNYSQWHNQHQTTTSAVTHRPIARSVRHNSTASDTEENASGVPSGHRHPILGVHWYPGDVYGSFVSASISGEILVWDARGFIPVFATYTHVYSGLPSEDDVSKSVAPLQCMDLPKTPEGCPHGCALLALGLAGGDGRGVIQLCDAFRGGSATHELIGHGTSGGGVNTITWDPQHPFRLASGGDDGTVRLWDVRKAGSAACLGVLDRENGPGSDVTRNDNIISPFKKQRARMSTGISRMDGIESHGSPVSALAFAPGGEDLVSSGADGSLCLWDLRPNSCYLSSTAASQAAVFGGRLIPTHYSGVVSNNTLMGSRKRSIHSSIAKRLSPKTKSVLAVIQPGSRNTAMVLSASNASSKQRKNQIIGHSLFGLNSSGSASVSLTGHLDDVTCLVPIVGNWDNRGANSSDTTSQVKFFSGGKDGMVLSWGVPVRFGNVNRDESDQEKEYNGYDEGHSITAILKRQCNHRRHQRNRRFQEGNVSGRHYFGVQETLSENNLPLHDVDNW
eukprot:g3551.t1 g3551   contig12:2303120-2304985(+)